MPPQHGNIERTSHMGTPYGFEVRLVRRATIT